MENNFLMPINQFDSDIVSLETNGIALHKNLLKKGTEISLHWHDYFEIEFILNGTLEHTVNTKTNTLSKGNIYLLTYYDTHSLKAIEDTTLLNIRFRDTLIPQKLSQYILERGVCFEAEFYAPKQQFFMEHYEQLEKDINNKQNFSSYMIKSIITEIVISIIRYENFENTNSIPGNVQKAISVIRRDFTKNISLKSVANSLYLSPNYLGGLFKKNTNQTFNSYLNQIRLQHACNLLHQSNLQIKDIAFAAGFNSIEYFSYVFKNFYNMSPADYKKSINKKQSSSQ